MTKKLTDSQLSVTVTDRELAAIADLCRAVGGHDALLGKVQAALQQHRWPPGQQFENVYVDVPDHTSLGDVDDCWVNVANFKTKEEAVAWVRANIGDCDADGRIELVTVGDPVDAESSDATH